MTTPQAPPGEHRDAPAGVLERPHSRLVLVLLATAGALLAASALTVCDSLELGRRPLWGLALLALTAAMVWRPVAASTLALFAVPFFGNHPGGRYLELLNLPLAAASLGLGIEVWRRRRAPPSGWVWLASFAVVSSAALALVTALPSVLVRGAQVSPASLTLVQTLVASEGDPLYSVGSFLRLVLCVVWALSLRWADAQLRFARGAVRAVAASVVVVMTLGALRFHGVLDLHRWWFGIVDPNLAFDDPMQSIFWNPGWFAGYFSLAFGLSLALLWLERPPWRWLVAALLGVSWSYFLLSRQRAGIIAAVAIVLLSAWLGAARLGRKRRWLVFGTATGLLLAAVLVGAAFSTATWQPGTSRLLAGVGLDEFRSRLWRASLLMWREAPLFGIGEGAFCWRFRDFVAADSALDVPFRGDAHNAWFLALSTRGLVGLAALASLFVVLLRALRRLLGGSAAPEARGLGIGVACALLGAFLFSTVQGLFYIQGLQVLFWAVVSLASLGDHEPGDRVRHILRSRAMAVALGLLLVARVVTAWPAWAGLEARLAAQPRGFYPLVRMASGVARWSSQRGVLCLYPRGRVVRLRVSSGRRPEHLMPVQVTFRVGRQLVDRFELRDTDWIERAFLVPEAAVQEPPAAPLAFGECRAQQPALLLRVETSNVWSRLTARGLPDYRHLGVAVAPAGERE